MIRRLKKKKKVSTLQLISCLINFQTVFELNTHQNSAQCEVMKNKRKVHGGIIQHFQEKTLENETFQNDIAESMENV